MEIWLYRHGVTEWNKEKRLQGNSDTPLSEEGIAQAKEAAERIRNVHFDRIYSSPLIRAFQTAEILRGDRDLPIIKDNRIREISFGDYEGRLYDELIAIDEMNFNYFFDKPESYETPPAGESFEDICKRAADFWKNVIIPLNGQAERIMVVAHGALNMAQMCFVKGHGIDKYWEGGLQKNCMARIVRYENGVFTVDATDR